MAGIARHTLFWILDLNPVRAIAGFSARSGGVCRRDWREHGSVSGVDFAGQRALSSWRRGAGSLRLAQEYGGGWQ